MDTPDETYGTHRPILFYEAPTGELHHKAMAVAKDILSFDGESHPDLICFGPEGKGHLFVMEKLRGLISDVALPPTQSSKKIYFLSEIDRMLPSHSNALLKTLEEAPDYVVFLLTTPHIYLILPTILSRCTKIAVKGKELVEAPLTTSLEDHLQKAIESAYEKKYRRLILHIEEIESEIQADSQSSRHLFSSILQRLYEMLCKKPSKDHHCPKKELVYRELMQMQAAYDRHVKVKVLLEASLLKLCKEMR